MFASVFFDLSQITMSGSDIYTKSSAGWLMGHGAALGVLFLFSTAQDVSASVLQFANVE
jgi:hypothetical protein